MELPTFPELVTRLALNAVDVQRLWNGAYTTEIEAFRIPIAVEPWAHGLLQGTAPPRLAIKSFDIQASVLLTTSFDEAFELKAVPLNVAYKVWQGVDYTKQSRIGITVEQCAAPNSASLIPEGGNHGGHI